VALIPGNLLSENNQSVETSVGGWASFSSVSSGVVQSGTQFFDGTKSVQSTANAGTAGALGGLVTTIDLPVVVPGRSYVYSYFVRPPVDAVFNANIDWYQSNNTTFVSSVNSPGQFALANTWTPVYGGGVAPALSGVARLYLQVTSGLSNGSVVYFDVMFFGWPQVAAPVQLFLPGSDPVGLPPWGGAPDSDHSVIVYPRTAQVSFSVPSPRYFSLLALTSETGQGATALALSNIADPFGPPLLLPGDLTGGMQPWTGAPDSVTVTAVSVTAGTASVTFTAPQPTAGLGALPGTASVTVTAQQPTTGLGALPGTAAVGLTAQGPVAGLGSLPGTGVVALAGQGVTAGLGALPGTAPLNLTSQQPTTGLGALPGTAPVLFTGQSATVSVTDDAVFLGGPLFTPDDPLGGIAPWTGAPDSSTAVSVTAFAGTAAVSFTAQQPVAGAGALPGTAAVTFTAPQPTAGLGALPGTASVTVTAQQPVSGLGALPGTAAITVSAQTATAGLGALPGTAPLSLTAPAPVAGVGALPGTAPVAFTSPAATVSTTEDPQAQPVPLFTPGDLTGGVSPWTGAPQGLLTGDTTVNAGTASLTLAAQGASTGIGAGAGTAPVALAAPSPSAAFSGTATAGLATITLTALNASPGVAARPSGATLGLSARTPSTALGARPGTAAVGLTAVDPAVVLPQSAGETLLRGREPDGLLTGRESVKLSGRESGQLTGREPVSSATETEGSELHGREP
jgi:hypothetical protein